MATDIGTTIHQEIAVPQAAVSSWSRSSTYLAHNRRQVEMDWTPLFEEIGRLISPHNMAAEKYANAAYALGQMEADRRAQEEKIEQLIEENRKWEHQFERILSSTKQLEKDHELSQKCQWQEEQLLKLQKEKRELKEQLEKQLEIHQTQQLSIQREITELRYLLRNSTEENSQLKSEMNKSFWQKMKDWLNSPDK